MMQEYNKEVMRKHIERGFDNTINYCDYCDGEIGNRPVRRGGPIKERNLCEGCEEIVKRYRENEEGRRIERAYVEYTVSFATGDWILAGLFNLVTDTGDTSAWSVRVDKGRVFRVWKDEKLMSIGLVTEPMVSYDNYDIVMIGDSKICIGFYKKNSEVVKHILFRLSDECEMML